MRIFLAVLVLLLGILGLFLPMIPGIAVIFFGLYLINPDWFKKRFHKLRKRHK